MKLVQGKEMEANGWGMILVIHPMASWEIYFFTDSPLGKILLIVWLFIIFHLYFSGNLILLHKNIWVAIVFKAWWIWWSVQPLD